MRTATITIGRNVGDAPMSDDDWRNFHDTVIQLLQARDGTVLADASYTGEWDGASEDACIVLAEVPEESDGDLRDALARVAHRFMQEAIGLTLGVGELVGEVM